MKYYIPSSGSYSIVTRNQSGMYQPKHTNNYSYMNIYYAALMIFSLVFLSACVNPPKEDGTLIYGTRPISKHTSIIQPSQNLNKDDVTLSDNIGALIIFARDDIRQCVKEEYQTILDSTRLAYDTENTSVFLAYSTIFEKNGKYYRSIYINEATWRTFAYMRMANALADMHPDIDLEWYARYMLYIRGANRLDRIVPPTNAAGLVHTDGKIANFSDEQTQKLMEGVVRSAQRYALFVLSHELHHHVAPLRRGEQETAEEFSVRQIEDELNADQFAANVMLCRYGHFDALYAPRDLFFDWILTMQGAKHSLSAGTHPLDHERAIKMAIFIKEKLSILEQRPYIVEQIRGHEEYIESLTSKFRGGAEEIARDLNEEANEVTLESLKLK